MTTRTTITKARIEAAVRAVDAGREARVSLTDARVPGLTLTVGRASMRWALGYKVALAGGGWSSGRRLVLGDLASMDLDQARDAAIAAKASVASGVDPAAAKRARREANVETASSRTISAALDRFEAERGGDWTAATRKAFRGDFAVIRAAIGDAPLGLVDRARLASLISDFLADQSRGGSAGLRQATRIAGILSSLWRQAGPGNSRFAGWGWPGVDVAVADRLPVPGGHRLAARSRVLSAAEIHDLWPALVASGARAPHRLVLALSILTGARIGALALIEERDLDLDPVAIVGARDSGPTFTIRAAEGRKFNAKARREAADLVLPLAPQAAELFRRALEIRRGSGQHVFESRVGPLRADDVTAAWSDLRRRGAAPADATAHDCRRSMRSHLSEIDHGGGWADEELLLGHRLGGATAKAYDRGRRLSRLRPLADAWGRRLEAIVGGTPAPVRRLREPA